jgi:hypothetical protein
MSKKHCVQCGEEFKSYFILNFKFYGICQSETCPNYGLVAVAIEDMPVEEKE